MNTELVLTSVLLGVGLAMDAFSVSIANGLADRHMKTGRVFEIAGTFAAFQFAMPMIGWFLVTRMAEKFEWFRPFIPWIALILLLIIGGGLLKDGIEENREKKNGGATADAATEADAEADADAGTSAPAAEAGTSSPGGSAAEAASKLTFAALMMQGIATSIDALSVGFTTAAYSAAQALASSLIIGVVTLAICIVGLRIGRKLGALLAGRASILGGVILIAIGLEIWIKGVFF